MSDQFAIFNLQFLLFFHFPKFLKLQTHYEKCFLKFLESFQFNFKFYSCQY